MNSWSVGCVKVAIMSLNVKETTWYSQAFLKVNGQQSPENGRALLLHAMVAGKMQTQRKVKLCRRDFVR